MSGNWQEMTAPTAAKPIAVERLRITNSGTAVENGFDLPSISRLSAGDQWFPAVFDRSHGSLDMTNIVLK